MGKGIEGMIMACVFECGCNVKRIAWHITTCPRHAFIFQYSLSRCDIDHSRPRLASASHRHIDRESCIVVNIFIDDKAKCIRQRHRRFWSNNIQLGCIIKNAQTIVRSRQYNRGGFRCCLQSYVLYCQTKRSFLIYGSITRFISSDSQIRALCRNNRHNIFVSEVVLSCHN